MENINAVLQIINSVGFPICVAIILFWYVNKLQMQHNTEIEAVREQHREETKAMTEAINNNTLVLQKLVDKLYS